MQVDLLIKNVKVFNVYMRKFISEDVTVLNEKFFYIGKDNENKLEPKEIIDGKGSYLIPGLIDIHMHIESSMTTPFQFSQAVIPHGVTTVVADPHEIANVFGIEGIKAFIDNDKNVKLDIFYGIPSSVPSTSPHLETTGGIIKEKEVSELLNYNKIKCLGEVMNFKDLIEDEHSVINNIIKIIKEKKPYLPLEGHCPKIEGIELAQYIYRGIDGDHTQQTPKSLEEKIKNGMFVEIQEKSMTQENLNY
jgi:adenine deaminase